MREWEFGLLIKYKNNLCIITVYNNVGMSRLICKMRAIIQECMINYETIVICGDMNARVGEEQACNEGIDENLSHKSRVSEDKVTNAEGKKLLKLSEELGLILLNGRVNGDERGAITYIGGNDLYTGSVIDLVWMVDRSYFEPIEKLEVVPRIESDHLPVTFRTRMNALEDGITHDVRSEKKDSTERIIWKDQKAQDFREKLRNKIREAGEETGENVKWENIKNEIFEAAREAGLTKKPKSANGNSNYWNLNQFSEECREIRKEVWKCLKDWLKDRNPLKK